MRATIGADVAADVIAAKAADPTLSGAALADLIRDRHGLAISRHAALAIWRRHRAAAADPLGAAHRAIVAAARADARGEPALSVSEILARFRVVAGDGHNLGGGD